MSDPVEVMFFNSRYVYTSFMVPPEMLYAYFGPRFKTVSDRNPVVVGLDTRGEVMLSRERLGEPLAFDEALEAMVNDYPNREKILRALPRAGWKVPE